MENVVESDVWTTIKEFCREKNRALTGNWYSVVATNGDKFIGGLYVSSEMFSTSEHV